MAFTKFELLTSPSFEKIRILSILFLTTQRDPRKFPASTAVPVLAFPSSYLKVPNREFKQIATAGASTAVVTEKVWGEYFSVVCPILAKRNTKMLEAWAKEYKIYFI